MSRQYRIRPGRPGDGAAAFAVFRAAVRQGAAAHYSEEERHAWAPHESAGEDWETRLLSGTCIVSERADGVLDGFMTLGDDGYLDFAYVLPSMMGSGLAGAIYDAIEAEARKTGMHVLSTEASHLARSFLTRRGWRTDARQSVIRHGVAITNFRMSKVLTTG